MDFSINKVSRSRTSEMQELSVAGILQQYNLIVPEIQREYVWGENENRVLENFLLGIVKKESAHIGFLYSYCPDYNILVSKEGVSDVYLIDGQQRFTTITLLLFYLALKEGKKEQFISLFRFHYATETIAFDYRVRNLTHRFIIEFIERSNSVKDLLEMDDSIWLLEEFKKDVTVKNILKAFKHINQAFKECSDSYFEYLKEQVKFWHFETEKTSQGEELYITMNARGRTLANNEKTKAELFEREVEGNKLAWGEKWEEWQEFFWQKKLTNKSADNGFNEFLLWVQEIEELKDGIKKRELRLQKVEGYFEALQFLTNKVTIKIDHNGVSITLNELNREIDIESLVAPSRLPNERPLTEYRKRFILYALLLHVKKLGWEEQSRVFYAGRINLLELYRLARALRNTVSNYSDDFLNNKRKELFQSALAFETLHFNLVEELVEEQNLLLSAEERFKLSLYKAHGPKEDREVMEHLIWKAESHPLNNYNISSLLELNYHHAKPAAFILKGSLADLEPEKFDFKKFRTHFLSFVQLIPGKDIDVSLLGNFINTDVYELTDNGSRLIKTTDKRIPKRNGFLQMVLAIGKTNQKEFLWQREKAFLRSKTEAEIYNTTDKKEQLYIYYILHHRLLSNWRPWLGDNFGVTTISEGINDKSLFKEEYRFQHYNSNWAWNSDRYIAYHRKNDDNINYIQKLLDWANS